MTATCSLPIVSQLQKVTSIKIKKPNIFWPGPLERQHRHVSLFIEYTTQTIRLFKAKIKESLESTTDVKYIWYTNARAVVENNEQNFKDWIDESDKIKCDVIPLAH
jgi:hypothetical protein